MKAAQELRSNTAQDKGSSQLLACKRTLWRKVYVVALHAVKAGV